MKINNQHYHTIWLKENDETTIQIIDQRHLPHDFVIEDLKTVDEVAAAIKDMHVRGAPLIGVTAAFGMYLAAQEADHNDFKKDMIRFANQLKDTRPTAINLAWAVDQQLAL
ncbi:MAG: methylthioribose-1-phosphate isomerase, partial [Saprospiraceae bacterium]